MLTRFFAAALAAGSVAYVSAYAQTGTGTPGSNQSHQQMAPSPEKGKPKADPAVTQAPGLPGSGSADSDKTRPSITPTTELSDSDKIHQPTAANSDKTSPSGGPTADTSGPSQAQRPTGSGRFDPSQYKTKVECLNAASSAYASFSLCSSLK